MVEIEAWWLSPQNTCALCLHYLRRPELSASWPQQGQGSQAPRSPGAGQLSTFKLWNVPGPHSSGHLTCHTREENSNPGACGEEKLSGTPAQPRSPKGQAQRRLPAEDSGEKKWAGTREGVEGGKDSGAG